MCLGDVLFTIERGLNRNTVIYKVKKNGNGKVHPNDPVEVYWIMLPDAVGDDDEVDEDLDEDPLKHAYKEEPLLIEKQFAYGVNIVQPNVFEVRALKKLLIHVQQLEDGTYVPISTIQGKSYRIQRILIHTVPQTMKPWPRTVQMHACVLDEHGAAYQFYFKRP